MPVTTTLNPLPFRDLEPHRFEDLIRQLVYDFRIWKRLEATGRSGGDSGFDIRGIETGEAAGPVDEAEQELDDARDAVAPERVWLIQCKREKTITPKQLETYLDEIPGAERQKLYGIIFAACCGFSKKSRDTVATWCRNNQIQEFQVWGIGEIEDLLMQPKNDHILFAFFGISLQVRRRSTETRLRSRLAMKKKVKQVLLAQRFGPVLFRDPTDHNFPFVKKDADPKSFLWKVRNVCGLDYRGLKFEHKKCLAYVGPDNTWDAANKFNDAIPQDSGWNIWHDCEIPPEIRSEEEEARQFWMSLPAEQRGTLSIEGYIPIEKIIAIDEIGDSMDSNSYDHTIPTVFVHFENGYLPFDPQIDVEISVQFGTRFSPKLSKRVEVFPSKFRSEIAPQQGDD